MTWSLALPALFTLLFWWFSTGAILYLDGLPRRSYKWSLAAAACMWALAICGLRATADDTSVQGAYIAFSCALLVWAWHEMAFLMGLVSGPRRSACPPEARGWPRVQYAVQAVLYHELALLLQLAMLLAMLQDAANPVGWWTFAILWTMRLSAKLNVFLGVRNLNEAWLPANLKYLHSYFRQRSGNALLPVSVLGGALAAALAWMAAVDPSTVASSASLPAARAFHASAYSFAATLFTLATLEHVLMVLPLSADALWAWAWRSRRIKPG